MEEQIIEVDKYDNKIGLKPRDDFYKSNFIHRAVHLILFNSKNEILLQQRSSAKKVYPNLFTYSVDATVANESYEDCIQREMKEELGISINVKRVFTYPLFDTIDKAWHCVFVGKTDNKITPEEREIQKVKWIGIDELKKDILKSPNLYTPQLVEGIKKYFDDFYETKK